MRQSNYEIMKVQMRGEFLKYDQAAMIKKFHLRSDDDHIYIRYYDREYAIDRRTGNVMSAAGEAEHNESMPIYDVLCNSKPGCMATGKFVNMRSTSTIQRSASKQEGDGVLDGFAKDFDGRDEALAAACERLGGRPEGKADVSYRIPMFDFLDVTLKFWDSDDEFPPTLQLFVDAHMMDFMHYETAWFALRYLMDRLRAEITE